MMQDKRNGIFHFEEGENDISEKKLLGGQEEMMCNRDGSPFSKRCRLQPQEQKYKIITETNNGIFFRKNTKYIEYYITKQELGQNQGFVPFFYVQLNLIIF